MPILTLHGCTPEPLGNYLKALGVFRLVAEQADCNARAWWDADVLKLASKLEATDLLDFFLGNPQSALAYNPSPIFAPWGGRPGFHEQGSNPKAKERLKRLKAAVSRRPQIASAAGILDRLSSVLSRHRDWNGKTKKFEATWFTADKAKKDKNAVIAASRNGLPREFGEWMDACLALEDDASFGILFGTGGNEGSADINNNFWYFVEECVGSADFQTQGIWIDRTGWFSCWPLGMGFDTIIEPAEEDAARDWPWRDAQITKPVHDQAACIN